MLCDTIKSLRKKRGLSQAQIALKLGITQGAVSQWETGATEPGADQLLALAKIFDVSVYEIKGKVDPDTKKEPAQGGLSDSVKRLFDEVQSAGLTDAEVDYLRAQIAGIKALRKP